MTMTSLFSKSLNEVTADDVHGLVKEEYPEGSSVEYKEKLPHKSGGIDSWYTGGNSIGDYARNEILEEVIAFANTHGGHVVLGIKESDDHPHRAVGIEPIPRCDDLASRFRYFLRDGIDPQIPLVHVQGVRTNGDAGVIVIRVPQSRMAPHRHKWTLQCYYRHAGRTEKMTMREVQDLTLRISRGLEEIEATYKKRSESFRAWVSKNKAIGIRTTLIPLTPIFVERIDTNRELFLPWQQRLILSIDNAKKEISLPASSNNERPILRGMQRSGEGHKCTLIQKVYTDGLLELSFIYNEDERKLFQGWIIATAGNGLLMADAFRRAAGAPDIEYGLELELYNSVGPVKVAQLSELSASFGDTLHPIDSPCVFPRYSFGDSNEISRLIEEIIKDIHNAGGYHPLQGKYMLSWQE